MSESKEVNADGAPLSSSGWEKHYSKTHEKFYWHNKFTNAKSWTEPANGEAGPAAASAGYGKAAEDVEPPSKRRALDRETGGSASAAAPGSSSNNISSGSLAVSSKPKVAIIVPFRDLHKEQKRQQHMIRFVPEMTAFLAKSNVPFFIYIVEQSNDGRKFNRGKLLNIGFELACKDGCKIFVLHDVDLLPSANLSPWYTSHPQQPVHIARVWNRYNDNPKYFGGIVAFSEQDYRKINGFPNNFWGWGGEDDEMYRRVSDSGLVPTAPTAGSIIDLEEMTLSDKLTLLKSNSKWKCMNKTEVLAEHKEWQSNGLSSLIYTEKERTMLGDFCARITVDVQENNHWSDLVCHHEDAQYDKSVESLKAAFEAKR